MRCKTARVGKGKCKVDASWNLGSVLRVNLVMPKSSRATPHSCSRLIHDDATRACQCNIVVLERHFSVGLREKTVEMKRDGLSGSSSSEWSRCGQHHSHALDIIHSRR